MPRLRLKDHLVIAGGILLIAVFTLALIASPARAQTTANGPYYATPSWDQTLPSNSRFIVLTNMNSAAVLDRETGLVWEKSPTTTLFEWSSASAPAAADHCNGLTTGNRKGWRLPTIQELASLVDPTQSPSLPSGHPFTNVSFNSFYWSATTANFNTAFAWNILFDSGGVENIDPKGGGTVFSFNSVWCVRGGSGVDIQ